MIRPINVRKDRSYIRDIEIKSYEQVIPEELYGDRWHTGSVFILDRQPVGFYLYQMKPNKIEIVRFAVHPKWRQALIGSRLMDALVGDVRGFGRITCHVEEENLPAHLFLRSHSFRCVNTLADGTLYFVRKLKNPG